VAPCIDTGHVTVFATRTHFMQERPEGEFWALAEDGRRARDAWPLLEASMAYGREALLGLVERVAALGGPLHFHLHDAHPLSLLSHYGVRDHLSFTEQVPVPREVSANGHVTTLLGTQGLERVIGATLKRLPPERVTFTVEVHHTRAAPRAVLGAETELFHHWMDHSNAELTSAWVDTLVANAELVRAAATRALEAERSDVS
jgi:hypothetical protein